MYNAGKKIIRLPNAYWLLTGSELMMILGGPEKYCSPSVKVGTYENDVINGVLAEVLLTVGSVDALTHPVVICPVQNV